MGIFSGYGCKDTEGGGDGVTSCFDGEFNDILAIEVDGIFGEGSACTVFDTLVDGEDGEVACFSEAAGIKDEGQVFNDIDIAITLEEDLVNEVRACLMDEVFGDGLARMV